MFIQQLSDWFISALTAGFLVSDWLSYGVKKVADQQMKRRKYKPQFHKDLG